MFKFIRTTCLFIQTLSDNYIHVEEVFELLKKANLKLNFSKCCWFAKEFKFLGHVIAEGIIKVDNDKIKVVQEIFPRNILQIQQFLGLAGYYRKFVKNFAEIAFPLYQLTKKDIVWNWSSDCQKSFNSLKSSLTTAPILRMPDFKKPFFIYCDASALSLGAILGRGDFMVTLTL